MAKVFSAIVWPFAALLQLWEIRYFNGPHWVPIKRAPGALWAAMRYNVLPGEYYGYALWLPERKAHIDSYLYTIEGLRLFKALNRPLQPNPIDDKLAFYEMCKAHALPSPEVLAAFAPAGKLLEFETGRPPERDLFVKPRIGVGGDGGERFRWQGVVFESSRGCHLSPDDFGDYIATRARIEKRTLLIQPALSNHPALGTGPNAPLAAARLVTGISTDGNVFPIWGLIYFTQTDEIPARYASVALIDVASGRLMSEPQELWGAKRSNHRLVNLDIAAMPDWGAALQYAKVAHRACSNFAFIGWDIAFTIQGPVLLEGNTNWSASEYQSRRGEPLGHTKFADILAMWLRDSN
jgi:Sugar-transfer associated ATP-grasp